MKSGAAPCRVSYEARGKFHKVPHLAIIKGGICMPDLAGKPGAAETHTGSSSST